jgi:PDZ-binding kinase
LDENGEANAEDYVGTSSWSAPETFEDGPITAKADIFSFGLTIWEMLTLTVPHLPDTSDSVLDVSAEILDISEPHFGNRILN